MIAKEALATLKKLGKPQTATIYQRYGTGTNVFGVLTSEISRLQKKIKVDHALAMELWQNGNAEARILALLVVDPSKLTRADADGLLKDGPVRFVGWYLSGLVARLKADPDSISDADLEQVLATIEQEIRRSANWARYAMNGARISIGVFKPALRKQAIETARRIGKVDVDHGETYCKTPDAVPYIERASRRKRRP